LIELSVLEFFFLAMACNPEAQKKAQEEIDSVHRLPNFDDWPSLPYVEARGSFERISNYS
jgi:Cytochrome P450